MSALTPGTTYHFPVRNTSEAQRMKRRINRLGRLEELRKAADRIDNRSIRERHLFQAALGWKRIGVNDQAGDVLKGIHVTAEQEALLHDAAQQAQAGAYATDQAQRDAMKRWRERKREYTRQYDAQRKNKERAKARRDSKR